MVGDTKQTSGISKPTGGGSMRSIGETFSHNDFAGTASLSFPIFTSPCRGFAPSLALSYNSGGAATHFGLGFSLLLPRIFVRTDKRSPRYDGTDEFVLEGRGALRVCAAPRQIKDPSNGDAFLVTQYRPKREGAFERIEHWQTKDGTGSHWRITDASNVTSLFGANRHSRVYPADQPNKVAEWLIEQKSDACGNQIDYRYRMDETRDTQGLDRSAARYLDKIRYGAYRDETGQQNWHFEVVFDYGERDLSAQAPIPYEAERPWAERPDPFSNYRAGFEIRTARLCRGIMLFHRLPRDKSQNPVWVTSNPPNTPFLVHITRLNYTMSGTMLALRSIAQWGQNGPDPQSDRAEMPRLDFDYTNTNLDFLFSFLPHEGIMLANGAVCIALRAELNRKGLDLGEQAVRLEPDSAGDWRLICEEEIYHLKKQEDGRFDVMKPASALIFQPILLRSPEGDLVPLSFPNPEFIDLHGEGLPGLIIDDKATPLFAAPEGNGIFAWPAPLNPQPKRQSDGHFAHALQDHSFDGRPEYCIEQEGLAGSFDNNREDGWHNFQPYGSFPSEKLVAGAVTANLSGNGLGDSVAWANGEIRIYDNEGGIGYAPARSLAAPKGITTLHDAGRLAVRFANIFGDGGAHLVQIENGKVTCWPSTGLGVLAEPIELQNAPQFGPEFSPGHVFLADIDGSGTADLIYLRPDRLEIYANCNGNGFAPKREVFLPDICATPNALRFLDLLGNGTMVAVLTVRGSGSNDITYFCDFSNGTKPHLLKELNDMSGNSTYIHYSTSTEEYLAAKAMGQPWRQGLHMPVQIVRKFETVDHISGHRDVTEYRYRDGYFDTQERAFRGFAMVEKIHGAPAIQPHPSEPPAKSEGRNAPRLLTRTWYHTGARHSAAEISSHYASAYFQGDKDTLNLPDTVLSQALKNANAHIVNDAWSSLFGHQLRQEIYGLDEPDARYLPANAIPFSVTESSYEITLIGGVQCQPITFARPRETITWNYERKVDDPQISHKLAIEVDDFGHVIQNCEVHYARRPNAAPLAQQQEMRIRLSVDRYCQPVDQPDSFGHGLPCEQREYEIMGLAHRSMPHFTFDEIAQHLTKAMGKIIATLGEIKTEFFDLNVPPSARLLSWSQHYFWSDDLKQRLPLGQSGKRHLAHNAQNIVFSAQQIESVYGAKIDVTILTNEGGYSHSDGYWWASSGTQYYGGPDQYFLNIRHVDPFNAEHKVTYDAFNLKPIHVVDALGHQTSIAALDCYSLQPIKIIDENDICSEFCFDPIGALLATSVYGDIGSVRHGNVPLTGFRGRQPENAGDAFENAVHFLQHAAECFLRDHCAWQKYRKPNWQVTIKRFDHALPPASARAVSPPRLDMHVAYQDGHLKPHQTKQRYDKKTWHRSGRIDLNNRGAIWRSFEPSFCSSHDFEAMETLPPDHPVAQNIYDALGRIVKNIYPGGFHSQQIFGAWHMRHYDANDMIGSSSAYQEHHFSDLPRLERMAYNSALSHADTPIDTYFDCQGHTIRTEEHWIDEKGNKARIAHAFALDIQGHCEAIFDPRDVSTLAENAYPNCPPIVQNIIALTGEGMWSCSGDSGAQWVLKNVLGHIIRTWDARGIERQNSFDALQRPVSVAMLDHAESTAPRARITEIFEYGGPSTAHKARNACGHVIRHFDAAGLLECETYDLVGNLSQQSRRFCRNVTPPPDWNVSEPQRQALLEAHPYCHTATFDAAGRKSSETLADQSSITYSYWPIGAVQKVDFTDPANQTLTLVENVGYDSSGRQTKISMAHGLITRYHYHPIMRRLKSILTTHAQFTKPLQSLHYYYDPVGNVSIIMDRSKHTLKPDRLFSLPLSAFEYDALYRLKSATGQCAAGGMFVQPNPELQNYRREYDYDLAGNLQSTKHFKKRGKSPLNQQDMTIAAQSNRALPAKMEGDADKLGIHFDILGNQKRLPSGADMNWNNYGRMASIELADQTASKALREHYVYNGSGKLVRTAWVDQAGNLLRDRLHMADVELDRTLTTAPRQSAFIEGDCSAFQFSLAARAIARLSVTYGKMGAEPATMVQQLCDHLGSVTLELDADGAPLTYEHYFPFGETAFAATDRLGSYEPKRLRYTGKHFNAATGLYHFDVRHYDPKAQRWLSPDPGGLIDGLNRYAYVGNNPLTKVDHLGFNGSDEHTSPRTRKIANSQNNISAHQGNALVAHRPVTPRTARHAMNILGQNNAVTRGLATAKSMSWGIPKESRERAENEVLPALQAKMAMARENKAFAKPESWAGYADTAYTAVGVVGTALQGASYASAAVCPPMVVVGFFTKRIKKAAQMTALQVQKTQHFYASEAAHNDARPMTPNSRQFMHELGNFHAAMNEMVEQKMSKSALPVIGAVMSHFDERNITRDPLTNMMNAAMTSHYGVSPSQIPTLPPIGNNT